MGKSWITRGAITAERMRFQIARSGYTFNGIKLWSSEEVDMLRRLYPTHTYGQLEKIFDGRSYFAIRAKAQALGLSPHRHVWTGAEIVKLRRVFRQGSVADIKAAFPQLTYVHICRTASNHGIRRGRQPFKSTGILAIDQIRSRAYELGYSMPDVDEMSRSGRYFQGALWHSGHIDHRAIARAIVALAGNVSAVWDDGKEVG